MNLVDGSFGVGVASDGFLEKYGMFWVILNARKPPRLEGSSPVGDLNTSWYKGQGYFISLLFEKSNLILVLLLRCAISVR
jgi:hypothetical protein